MTDNHELQKTVNKLGAYIEHVQKYGRNVNGHDVNMNDIRNIHGWLTELKNIRSTEL